MWVKQLVSSEKPFGPRRFANVWVQRARQLEEAIIGGGPDTVAAFVFEPLQGDGGAVDMHQEFSPLAQEICKRHGVLMIADEVKADIPV
jgi:4-aminobutyrate aminotransferase-like enzyme